jgi:hypothetical protein
MKRLVLGTEKRMKALRLLSSPPSGEDYGACAGAYCSYQRGHPSFDILLMARQKIVELAYAPSGQAPQGYADGINKSARESLAQKHPPKEGYDVRIAREDAKSR